MQLSTLWVTKVVQCKELLMTLIKSLNMPPVISSLTNLATKPFKNSHLAKISLKEQEKLSNSIFHICFMMKIFSLWTDQRHFHYELLIWPNKNHDYTLVICTKSCSLFVQQWMNFPISLINQNLVLLRNLLKDFDPSMRITQIMVETIIGESLDQL